MIRELIKTNPGKDIKNISIPNNSYQESMQIVRNFIQGFASKEIQGLLKDITPSYARVYQTLQSLISKNPKRMNTFTQKQAQYCKSILYNKKS